MSSRKEVIPVNTDVEELGQLVNLPFSPERVIWNVTIPNVKQTRGTVPGPSDYGFTLDALITFSPQDMADFQSMANSDKLDLDVRWREYGFQSWYPDSYREMFTFDPQTETYLLDAPAYDASSIFGKDPYSMGGFFITRSGDVFLSMVTPSQ